MKKLLIIASMSVGFSACSSAENRNISNNANTNYNQNTALQQIRNQIKQPAENRQKDINAVQQQIEQGVSNVNNSSNQNTSKSLDREKLHDLQPAPETR